MSAPIIYKGTNQTLNRRRWDWTRTGGWTSEELYTGSLQAMTGRIVNLQAIATVDAMTLESSGGGDYHLIARYSTTANPLSGSEEPAVNVWELIGQDVNKDLKLLPRVLNLGQVLIGKIKQAVAELNRETDFTRWETLYNDFRQIFAIAAGAAQKSVTDTLFFFDHSILGINHFPDSQYVLRHAKICTRRNGTAINYSNCKRGLYLCEGSTGSDSAKLKAELAAAGTPLPAELFTDLNAIDRPPAVSGYAWGWVKKTPTNRPTALNKREITQEFWLDQWSLLIYNAVA